MSMNPGGSLAQIVIGVLIVSGLCWYLFSRPEEEQSNSDTFEMK